MPNIEDKLKELTREVDFSTGWAAMLAIVVRDTACAEVMLQESIGFVWLGDGRAFDMNNEVLASVIRGQRSDSIREALDEYISCFEIDIDELKTTKPLCGWTPARHAAQVAVCIGYLETFNAKLNSLDLRASALASPLLAPHRSFLATLTFGLYCSSRMQALFDRGPSPYGTPGFDAVACFVSATQVLQESAQSPMPNAAAWNELRHAVRRYCMKHAASIRKELSQSDALHCRELWATIATRTEDFPRQILRELVQR